MEEVKTKSAETSSSPSIQVLCSATEVAIEEAHQEACTNGWPMYKDPVSGYSVMTRDYLLSRKKCCGSRCRHCPYNHINVKKKPNTDASNSG